MTTSGELKKLQMSMRPKHWIARLPEMKANGVQDMMLRDAADVTDREVANTWDHERPPRILPTKAGAVTGGYAHLRFEKCPLFKGFSYTMRHGGELRNELLVPLAGIEPALLAELDFESSASTSSATGAFRTSAGGRRREAGGI
jgi:hypothetical protein